VQVLKAILIDLAERTRARGERLIVLLLHARGYSDHLYASLRGTLEREEIEYLSTHSLFSSNDPASFLPDGHYTEPRNRLISGRLTELIRRPRGGGASGHAPNPARRGL
jgi:hypothetical protein